MTSSIIVDILGEEPLNATLTAEMISVPVRGLVMSQQGQNISNAQSEESLATAITTMKEMVREKALSRIAYDEGKKELFAAGLQEFSKMTDLAPHQFEINTSPLESYMNMEGAALDRNANTAERPFAGASKQELMAAWKPQGGDFFAERAMAYNSIETLDVPKALKDEWRQRCFGGKITEKNTFVVSEAIAREFDNDKTLHGLLDTNLTLNDKLQILENFGYKHSEAFNKHMGQDSIAKQDIHDSEVFVNISFEVIFARNPEIVQELRARPELMEALDKVAQDNMTAAHNNYSADRLERLNKAGLALMTCGKIQENVSAIE